MIPGDKWAPLGLSTQEAGKIVAEKVKEISVEMKKKDEIALKSLEGSGVDERVLESIGIVPILGFLRERGR